MSSALPVLIFTPPAGPSPAEQWMADGRQAAAVDLVLRLREVPSFDPVYAVCARPEDGDALAAAGAERPTPDSASTFHFGGALAAWVERLRLTRAAYFGGASAPLIQPDDLRRALDRLAQTPGGRGAVVNNLHSTDWALIGDTAPLRRLAHRLDSDNALGWVLEREAGVPVVELAARSATRADLDTPTDFLMIDGHPALGERVQAFLSTAPAEARARISGLEAVLGRAGSTLTLIGRTSAQAWSELERRRSIWVRVFAEERGMVASGRLVSGRVRSLIGEAMRAWGPAGLVQRLASMSDGILWDNRVWMAVASWPNEADRFASDLGWTGQIEHPGLRELTAACLVAPVPIVCGGHGVVAGSLMAMLDRLGPAA
ncbi:MAG: hypothetical protein ACRDG5_05315 [Anaerolineales bacterium]